jgi:hypothetical protein
MSENLRLINVEKIGAKGDWSKSALDLISACPKIKKEREIKILLDRFGLGKSPKTLNAIGVKYGITRERVRQIVNNSVKKLQKNCVSKDSAARVTKIEDFIATHGGIASKDTLNEHFKTNEKSEQNSLAFMAALSEKLIPLKESNDHRISWHTKELKPLQIKKAIDEATSLLKNEKKVLSSKIIGDKIGLDKKTTEALLETSKHIMATDGGWGLISWPHVNPKSIRDKSKFIMKKNGKPMHYSQLTKKITEIGNKNVTKQSVHNELIKNADFVLVGRGIYALSEWGYAPGVVEEVIVEVLTIASEPLHKDEIVRRVLEKRIVKESTIILNLQKSRFKRVGKAVYTLN